jgi:hypothetical protein
MIKQSTNYVVLAADIYNIYKKICLENLADRTLIKSLITILKSSNYTFEYKIDTIE